MAEVDESCSAVSGQRRLLLGRRKKREKVREKERARERKPMIRKTMREMENLVRKERATARKDALKDVAERLRTVCVVNKVKESSA